MTQAHKDQPVQIAGATNRREFFRRAALTLGPLLLLGQGRHPPPQPQADPTGLYGMFFCSCGCRQVLRDCVCETAKLMRSKIDGYVAQGKNRDGVVAAMVEEYGITILQEPGKKGFNWFWYITPFVVFGIGGAAVFYVLKRMSAPSAPVPVEPAPDPQAAKEKEKILKDIENEIREGL